MEGKETKLLRVLAVGDGADIRDFYDEVFHLHNRRFQSGIAFEPTVCTLETAAVETVKRAMAQNNPFAVALIHLPKEGEAIAIGSAAQIHQIDPAVNFVILAASADHFKEIKERMPLTHKMLLIKKPFHPESVMQLTGVMGALWLSEKALQRVNREMRDVSRELMETNDALSVLARNLERSRRNSESRMIQRIRTLIMPVIQKLRHEKGLKRFKPDLDLLNAYIESLTTDLAADLKMAAMLSRTEIQVASLIKNGMASEEIAAHLNISLFTVKTHRKNIRRKLDIQNSGVNLRSYLESGLKEV
ncbi:MAG: helix-turn-helix transcriptional regulator [Desulfobacterales bacterium]|nr:helix-turn-helix transcriptional regulator [Desulfobacterales bacterium]